MNPFRIGLLLAAGAAGAMVVTAPAAFALSESTIKSECAAANGTYTTTDNGPGGRISKCCYEDIDGKKWCDVYFDGVYEGTDPAKVRVKPPRPIDGIPTDVITAVPSVVAPVLGPTG